MEFEFEIKGQYTRQADTRLVTNSSDSKMMVIIGAKLENEELRMKVYETATTKTPQEIKFDIGAPQVLTIPLDKKGYIDVFVTNGSIVALKIKITIDAK